jgi:hypothetical protein
MAGPNTDNCLCITFALSYLITVPVRFLVFKNNIL